MKTELHVLFRGMEHSDAVEASARKFVTKLEEVATDIMACRVSIALEQKHQHQGRPYGVRIDVTLPGHELASNRVHHEDVYIALRDAFEAMRRQISRVVQRRRGEVKHHA